MCCHARARSCSLFVCVILFTLLVGNTPWDEPTERSYEFKEYVNSGGKMGDELWEPLPKDSISLLRGMLKLDPTFLKVGDVVLAEVLLQRYAGTQGKKAAPGKESKAGLATFQLRAVYRLFDGPEPRRHEVVRPAFQAQF